MNMQTQPQTQKTGSRVQRVRHELKRRDLQVVRVENVTPNFRSVTFAGESLGDFRSDSFDDHVKLFLQSADGEQVMRDYTPRRYDAAARELTIEFSLHGDGFAAQWAAHAQPGQHATIGGPRGSFIVPTDFDWHLLIGDETALPAITRRLEELPSGTLTMALIQVDDDADRRVFKSQSTFNVTWASGADELLAAVRELRLPSGDGYAWCAAEASVAANVRRILVEEKGHDRHAIRAASYWKRGAIAHHENLDD